MESASFLVLLVETYTSLLRAAVGAALSSAKYTSALGASGVAGQGGAAVRRIAGVLVTAAVQAAAVLGEGPWRRRLSESVAKAPIAPERARRIVDIPRFFSTPILARGAFATDSDTPPPRIAPGALPAPSRVSPLAWWYRWRRGAPVQRPRGPQGARRTVCYALSPSAALLFLVQQRVKGRSKKKRA